MIIPGDKISCIILAGGKGVRFNNQDKGLVQLDGKPFIQHVINNIESQVNDIVISANRNLETYRQYSSMVVKDNTTDYHGPLSGLTSALPFCRHPWIMVIPCDMPFLPDNLVRRLAADIKDERIAVAAARGKLQLVFLMQASLLTSLQQHLDKGKYKMMQWLQSHNHVVVEFPGKTRAFDNINSEQDLH